MTDEDLIKITEAFHSVVQEAFGVDCKTHIEHHGFIARIKKRIEIVVRASLWTVTVTIVTGLLGLVGWALFHGGP